MGRWTDEAMKARPLYQKGSQYLTDQEALSVKRIYPTWDECVKLGSIDTDGKTGYKFTYGDDLYSCVNANPTFQADWVPGINTAALYTRIDEMHKGTIDDPIPYGGNMALEEGKYYSQNGVTYYCFRDTVNPVYHALADLVGTYVEVA